MSCGLESYRVTIGMFCGVLLKILNRKSTIAARRIRGLRVKTYSASIAMATLLALLIIGCVEPNPGPKDNVQSTSKSSNADADSNDQGNSLSPQSVDQLFIAINQLTQTVNRIETAQSSLNTQQSQNTAAVQSQLHELESKLDERLSRIEDNNDMLTEDVGCLHTKMEELEEENERLKQCVEEMEEKLDYSENYSKRNNLMFYGVGESEGETWHDCECKVKDILKEKMKIEDHVHIERAHRAGKAIIVRFLSWKDKEKVLRGARNLTKSDNISVREDFSQNIQNKRKNLVPLMKSLRSDGKRANLKFDKLVSDDGVFTFNPKSQTIEKLGNNRQRTKRSGDSSTGRKTGLIQQQDSDAHRRNRTARDNHRQEDSRGDRDPQGGNHAMEGVTTNTAISNAGQHVQRDPAHRPHVSDSRYHPHQSDARHSPHQSDPMPHHPQPDARSSCHQPDTRRGPHRSDPLRQGHYTTRASQHYTTRRSQHSANKTSKNC